MVLKGSHRENHPFVWFPKKEKEKKQRNEKHTLLKDLKNSIGQGPQLPKEGRPFDG